MWDRLQATSSATATATFFAFGRHRHQTSSPSHSDHTAGIPKSRTGRRRGNHGSSWPDNLDDPFGTLAVARSGSYKFEISRGKVVPQTTHADISLSSHQEGGTATPVLVPPPRNPRRLQQRQHHQQPLPLTNWRPASSVYGSDADHDDEAAATSPLPGAMHRLAAEVQISPPSSPDLDAARDGYFHVDVSPIDDEPVHFHEHLPQETSRHQPPQPSRQNGTNSIPEVDHMNRRAPTLVIPRTREPKPNHDQRRDHQTSSDQSPALQTEAKPRQPAAGDAPDTAPSVLDSVTRMLATPSGRGKSPASTFGQRMRALGRSKPDPVDSRPPWYGPSGRAKLLQPIRDDDGATTLTMPRKNVNGTVRGAAASNCPPDAQLETSNAAAAAGAATDTANSLQPLAQNGRASNKPATPSSSLSSTTSSTSPSSLLHRGRQQLQRSHLEAESPPSTSSDSKSSDSKSLTSSSAFTPREVIKRKPPPFPSTTASISAQARHASDPTIAGRSTTKDDRVEIASRFGVTTFATSNPATLRQERDRTPVPTPPLQSTSVMNRRRPVGGGHGGKSAAEPVLISMRNTSAPETESNPHRRPSDPTEHTHLTGSGQLVDRRSSASPAAKPLPLAPHELQSSKDPVETLKAEVDVLAHRRMNINKCIQQMTARMPSDNLMASQQLLRKRENEKIAALKEELAEVQKDEYTVGLKLHRAYKRMERNSNYEQTGLWVSRVAR